MIVFKAKDSLKIIFIDDYWIDFFQNFVNKTAEMNVNRMKFIITEANKNPGRWRCLYCF